MYKIYRYSIASLFLLISFNAFSQQDTAKKVKERKTSIIFSAANFSIAGLTEFNPYLGPPIINDYLADEFGICVEHKISKHAYICIGYDEWNVNPILHKTDIGNDPYGFHDFLPMYIRGAHNDTAVGALRFRYGYKMYDASCNYRFDKFKRHKFTGGAGISYAHGTNFYIKEKYFNYTGYYERYILQEKKENYVGIIAPIRYDLLLFKERIGLGLQSNFRKYFGLYSWQIDYGVHLSVNF